MKILKKAIIVLMILSAAVLGACKQPSKLKDSTDSSKQESSSSGMLPDEGNGSDNPLTSILPDFGNSEQENDKPFDTPIQPLD